MLIFRTILMWLLLGGLVAPAATVRASEASRGVLDSSTSAHSEERGLPQSAVEVARPSGFSVTNSMVATWIVAIGLIVFAQTATRHMKERPEGLQNFWEWLVEDRKSTRLNSSHGY